MYYNKYLKYKSKCSKLEVQIGGAKQFVDMVYLGHGAENYAFKLQSGQILRIRKNCEKLDGSENNVLTQMAGKTIQYFIKIFAKGNCFDLKEKLSDHMTDFCEMVGTESTLLCNYNYVIMSNAEGTNLLNYTIKTFGMHLQLLDILEVEDLPIIEHIRLLVSFLKK